ncbi:MAG: LysR substrate-binding domain-containing protein [Pseudomonadota bacterium]
MDTKRLRLFVLLAEDLHFGRAARRAGVAQSVLSVQIKRLEDEVGAQLFIRTRREVRLSEIGQRFLFEARAILDRLEQARRVAEALKSGKEQVLRLGLTTVAMLGPAPAIIGRYCAAHPHIQVELRELGTVDQETALIDRAIDLGFLHPPLDRLELGVLLGPPSRFLAMRRRSGSDEAVRRPWADVLRDPIVFYGRRRAPRLYDAFISSANALGIVPTIAAEARSFLSAVGAASAGIGTALLPEELRACAPGNVEVADLDDCPLVLQNGVAYRPDDVSPALDGLIAALSE